MSKNIEQLAVTLPATWQTVGARYMALARAAFGLVHFVDGHGPGPSTPVLQDFERRLAQAALDFAAEVNEATRQGTLAHNFLSDLHRTTNQG